MGDEPNINALLPSTALIRIPFPPMQGEFTLRFPPSKPKHIYVHCRTHSLFPSRSIFTRALSPPSRINTMDFAKKQYTKEIAPRSVSTQEGSLDHVLDVLVLHDHPFLLVVGCAQHSDG
jgi:hypothetical protein